MKVNVTEGDLALGVQVIVEKHGAKARYALQLLQTRRMIAVATAYSSTRAVNIGYTDLMVDLTFA